jgi:hypothetical protein
MFNMHKLKTMILSLLKLKLITPFLYMLINDRVFCYIYRNETFLVIYYWIND